MDSSVFEYFDIFLLVLARMGGLVFINPVFSRRGVPPMVRTGLVLALSLLIAPGVRSGVGQVMAFSTFDMVESLIREVILGLVIGCVFHIFFYMLYVAGDFLDTVFGLAMGKVMDPAGGVQTSILGQFVNVFFYLYFFATGCHLTMVRLFAYSYQVVPVGAGAILGGRILWYIITLFGSVFLMVIKLVLPFEADSPDSCVCHQHTVQNPPGNHADDALCLSHGRIYGPVYRGHDDGGPEAAYDVWVTGSGHSPG